MARGCANMVVGIRLNGEPFMFKKRLQRWIESPLSYKIDTIRRRVRPSAVIAGVLTPAFRLARSLNFRSIRIAAFDSIPKGRKFSLASDGLDQFLCIASDVAVSRMISVEGIFDFEKVKTAIRLLGPSFKLDTLVDIGANIGTICVPVLARGLAQNAIAIEPEPKNFRTLMANVYLGDVADRITCHNVALGAEDNATLRFDLSKNNSGDHRVHSGTASNFHFEADRDSITIKSSRLDTIVQSACPKSWLIWMDTQGYEGFILKGAPKILEAKVPMVLEFWPYGMTAANSYPALKEGLLRYSTYYDLRSDDPKPLPLSEATLDGLFAKYDGTIEFTDILVV
jgi:FkbM family methyltransferase